MSDYNASHTFSQPDLTVAATAFCCGLTIVSRDRGDFERAIPPLSSSHRQA